MASSGVRPTPQGRWQVWWRGNDGAQGSKTFKTKKAAETFRGRLEGPLEEGTWIDPRRGRVKFEENAEEWWQDWSNDPVRSPAARQATEGHLRLHIKPYFGKRSMTSIAENPEVVRDWQRQLEISLGWHTVMDCRSVLFRIMEAAVVGKVVRVNPVRLVKPPRKRVDPAVIFGEDKRRAHTPREFGRLLAATPQFYWAHFIAQAGTGIRPGELLGLQALRANLARQRLEIHRVRYDAGKFGTGYKDSPKSEASIRPVPMAPTVVKYVRGRLEGCPPDGLVFSGPGGGRGRARGRGAGLKRGTRSALSITNLRRVYKRAGEAAQLRQLALKGPHDLRHTFATWLEDAGIPTRVIDELMGHGGGNGHDGSAVGRRYRHTTPEMEARVLAAIEERLQEALKVAEKLERWPAGPAAVPERWVLLRMCCEHAPAGES